MTVDIGLTAENNQVRFVKQGSHPSAPSAGHVILYYVTGTAYPGMFVEDSNGAKYGPFITGSASPGGSGALNFLGSRTASNSALLLFDNLISSTYDFYILKISNLVLQTNNVSLLAQLSTDNGGTYETGNNYYSAGYAVANGGSPAAWSGNPSTAHILAVGVNNTVSRPVSASIEMNGFDSTALAKQWCGLVWFTNQTAIIGGQWTGELDIPGTAYNSFKIYASSGNIVSGIARLYGVSNS